MKEMCIKIPEGSCPVCGHRQFIVHEGTIDVYLTDQDGTAIAHKELDYKAIGKCLNCAAQFEMMPTSIGFVPMTRLRKILYEYSPSSYVNEIESGINNPMEAKE